MSYSIVEITSYNSKNIKPLKSIICSCDTAEKAIKLQKLHTELHKLKYENSGNVHFEIWSKVEVTTGFTDETKTRVA
jgi:hypothetical protein